MTPAEYDYLCKLLRDRSGIALTPEKRYLVESRLLPLARRAGIDNLSELVRSLRGLDAGARIAQVVEAMTTNETLFFRDKVPFNDFRNIVMPALMRSRDPPRRLRIWCAAASTGQEPYSIAMCLKEMGDAVAGWRIDILATDISTEVLEIAATGTYSQFEVQRGLPIQMLLKYFTKIEDRWQIAAEIRDMVRFQPFNLMDDFSALGTFDVVLCRNVLIYFDQETKADIFNRMSGVIENDGYLVLGAVETMTGVSDRFEAVAECRGVFAPAMSARASGHACFPLRLVGGAR